MRWVGRTKFSTIGVGTSIRLEEIPAVPQVHAAAMRRQGGLAYDLPSAALACVSP